MDVYEPKGVGRKYRVETFWSVDDYADTALARAEDPHEDSHHNQIAEEASEWNGGLSFLDAVSTAKNGWKDELPLVMSMARKNIRTLTGMGLIPSPAPQWDVSGSDVEVSRFLANDPEPMLDFPLTVQRKIGQTVKLVINRTASASVPADDMRKHGRMLVALIMAIQRLGLSAEVWADFYIASKYGSERKRNWEPSEGGRLVQRVRVKSATEKLDAGRVMFALANPAFFRQVAFGCWDGKDIGEAGKPARNWARGICGTRTPEEKEFYGKGALFTEALFFDVDPVPFLVKELIDLGIIDARKMGIDPKKIRTTKKFK